MVKYIFAINGIAIRVIECNTNPPQSLLEEEINERIDLRGFEVDKLIVLPGTSTGIFGRVMYQTKNVPRTFSLRSGKATSRRRAYAICSAAARLAA